MSVALTLSCAEAGPGNPLGRIEECQIEEEKACLGQTGQDLGGPRNTGHLCVIVVQVLLSCLNFGVNIHIHCSSDKRRSEVLAGGCSHSPEKASCEIIRD